MLNERCSGTIDFEDFIDKLNEQDKPKRTIIIEDFLLEEGESPYHQTIYEEDYFREVVNPEKKHIPEEIRGEHKNNEEYKAWLDEQEDDIRKYYEELEKQCRINKNKHLTHASHLTLLCSLPHKKPKTDKYVARGIGGKFVYEIHDGGFGIPSGKYPTLINLDFVDHIVRTGENTLTITNVRAYMKKLGIFTIDKSKNNRKVVKRPQYDTFLDQFRRLITCKHKWIQKKGRASQEHLEESFRDVLCIADEDFTFWQGVEENGVITVKFSDHFMDYCRNHYTAVNIEIVSEIVRRFPMALNVYLYSTMVYHDILRGTKQSDFKISYHDFKQIIGSSTKRARDLKSTVVKIFNELNEHSQVPFMFTQTKIKPDNPFWEEWRRGGRTLHENNLVNAFYIVPKPRDLMAVQYFRDKKKNKG